MPAPLVSIVTAFYNTGPFLEEAIGSVLAQTYARWELLLVDDGSTDEGTAIARRYAAEHPDRVVYIEHDGHGNRGAAASRNVGVQRARGTYVAILDGDDCWLPEKLEQQVGILESQPRAAMVCGASLYWYGWTGREDAEVDAVTTLGIPAPALYEPPELLTLLYPLGDGGAPCPSNILLRRSLMEEGGGFEEAFRGPYQLYEDQAFLCKIYLKHPVYVTDHVWDRYRVRPDSCVTRVVGAGQYEEVRGVFLEWFERYLSAQPRVSASVWQALKGGVPAPASAEGMTGRILLQRTRWSLRVAERNQARLLLLPESPDVLRVAIDRSTTGVAHDIQINHPRIGIAEGEQYTLRFRGRADRPRRASVGCSNAAAPWANLGLYVDVDLTSDWQPFALEFAATAADANGRIHFDLGGSDVPVEIAEVGLSSSGVVGMDSGRLQTSLAADDMQPVSADWGWDRGLPIDRYYLERFLTDHTDDLRGAVAEIGDDLYTRRFGATRVTSVDVLDVSVDNPKATVIIDLERADQGPPERFDCLVVPQTLQFVYDTRQAVRSLHRMLRPHGVLLATLPGVSSVGDPCWTRYWGFTPASARRMFEEMFPASSITVGYYGNVLAAASFLRGLASEELTAEQLEYRDERFPMLICVRAVRE